MAEVAIATNAAADASGVRLVWDGRTMILDLRSDAATQAVLEMPIQSGDWIYVPAQQRSRLRDEMQFWGSLLSLFSSVVAVGILIAQ